MRKVDLNWNRNARNNLALLVRESGKTQKVLCKEMDINESLLSQMLNGDRMTIGNVAHVAKYFGVSIDWLVGYESTKEFSFEKVERELNLIGKIRELLDEN